MGKRQWGEEWNDSEAPGRPARRRRAGGAAETPPWQQERSGGGSASSGQGRRYFSTGQAQPEGRTVGSRGDADRSWKGARVGAAARVGGARVGGAWGEPQGSAIVGAWGRGAPRRGAAGPIRPWRGDGDARSSAAAAEEEGPPRPERARVRGGAKRRGAGGEGAETRRRRGGKGGAAGGAAHAEALRRVQRLFEEDPESVPVWEAYAEARCRQQRDPARVSTERLEAFAEQYAEGICAWERELVEKVDGLTASDPDAGDAWRAYCDEQGDGAYDPAGHSDEFLDAFLNLEKLRGAAGEDAEEPRLPLPPPPPPPGAAAGSKEDGAAAGERPSEEILKLVREMLDGDDKARTAWRAWATYEGGGVFDVARHSDDELEDFIGRFGAGEAFDYGDAPVPDDCFVEEEAARGRALPPPPPPPTGPVAVPKPGRRKRERGGAAEFKGPIREEDRKVRLTGVPREYNHQALVALHTEVGLEARSVESSRFVFERNTSGAAPTCSVVLLYVDAPSARRAAARLQGRRVTPSDGEAVVLGVQLMESPAHPQVLISGIPEDVKLEDVRQLHTDVGLGAEQLPLSWSVAHDEPTEPGFYVCLAQYVDRGAANKVKDALDGFEVSLPASGIQARLTAEVRKARVGDIAPKSKEIPPRKTVRGVIRNWNEERGFGFIRPAEYAADVFFHRKVISGNGEPAVGAAVQFQAKFAPLKNGYTADRVRISQAGEPEDEPSEEVPPQLESFGEHWGLERGTLAWLSRFPQEIQDQVVEKFEGHQSEGKRAGFDSIDRRLRSFTYVIKNRLEPETTGKPATAWPSPAPTWEPSSILPPQALVAAAAPAADVDEEVPPEEPASSLTYFCEMWRLDLATVRWLRRKPLEVQDAVIAEFDGSDADLSSGGIISGVVELPGSTQLVVNGLPPHFPERSLRRLFEFFGEVLFCSVVPGQFATVQMSTPEEALAAFEDLNLRTPVALRAPISVRFGNSDAGGDAQVPTGVPLLGVVQAWDAATGSGVVEVPNCGGIDAKVSAEALVDAEALLPGTSVIVVIEFEALEDSLKVVQCVASVQNVQGMLEARGGGMGRMVREFARFVQERLGVGPKDVRRRAAPAAVRRPPRPHAAQARPPGRGAALPMVPPSSALPPAWCGVPAPPPPPPRALQVAGARM